MIIFIIIFIISLFIIIPLIAIKKEKELFNNSICKVCGQKLKHFDTDSQGGRGYTCPSMCYSVWISYNCVDKNKGDKKLEVL